MIVSVRLAIQRLRKRRAALDLKLKGKVSERTRKYAEDVELPQVAAAFRRVSEGTYGDCGDCGEVIEPRRLKAIPEVPVCKACEDNAKLVRLDLERRQ